MKVKKFVNLEDFSCNVFICSSDKGNFIVDLGYFDSKIDAYLKNLPSVDFVLQTHGHFDHIMGLNSFAQKYPDVPVYIMEDEIEVAKNPMYNGSMSMLYSPFSLNVTLKPLKEGSCKIGDFKFQVIHTPGHTKGSCMFYFKEDDALFTGDTIIETSIGRTDLPTGSEATILRSLNKFKKIEFPESTMCYFGHGEDFDYKYLMKHNTFLF